MGIKLIKIIFFFSFTEDEIWVEKAIDIGSSTGQQTDETSPKSTKSSKNNSSYKANCLTPRYILILI